MDEEIRAYFAGDIDAETAEKRIALRHAVMRQIWCARTRRVLDVRRAVLYTVTNRTGKSGSEVVAAKEWDKIGDGLRALCAARGITLDVVDGREVYGG